MNHFNFGGAAVSHAAMMRGMPNHPPLREMAAPAKPVKRKTVRTSIGKDIAADREETARIIHNSLRQVGLTMAYAAVTLRSFIRLPALQALADRGQEAGLLRSGADIDVDSASSLAASVLGGDQIFQRAAYDENTITFTTPRLKQVTTALIDPLSDNFESMMRRLLPQYRKPVGYNKAGYSSVKLDFGDQTGADFDVTVSYEDLLKAVNGTGISHQSPLFMGKAKLPAGVQITINLTGTMTGDVQTVTSYPTLSSLATGTGSLPSNAYATMTVSATISVKLPKDWAMYATYAETDAEFVPTLAMSHLSTLMGTALGFKGGRAKTMVKNPLDDDNAAKAAARFAKVSSRVSNVATSKRLNASRTKALGFAASIRTNSDGYAILPNGALWHIPTEDSVDEFVTLSKEASDGTLDGGKFDYPSRILYVDPVKEVLVYTTVASSIATVKLRGSRPLDDISIAKYGAFWALPGVAVRHLPILNGTADLPFPASVIGSLIVKMNEKGGAYANMPYFADMWRPLPASGPHALSASLSPGDWGMLIRMTDGKNNPLFPDAAERERLLKLLAYADDRSTVDHDATDAAEATVIGKIHEAAMAFTVEAQKFAASGGFELANPPGSHSVDVLNTLKVALYAYTHMLPRWHECDAKRKKNQRANEPRPLDRFALKDNPIAIPNLSTDALFPHQAEVAQNLNVAEPPTAAVIGGAPGFGKTIAIIIDALLLLSKGKIKRPLVLVPNKLEAQFVDEINTFTKGKVNAYCATFQNLKDMQSPDGLNFSYEDTVKFLRDLPPNTILVSNYNTLTNNFSQFPHLYESVASYDTIGTTETLTSFPFVDMFYAAGVDYVCGDESHKVKNLKSGRAEAFLALCAKVDYIRLSSGTTVNNVVSDLVGQMQKINPLALGASVEAFQDRFLQGEKQVSRASQAEDITEAMRDYALVIQKDSRSWSYMLPPLSEIYHRVELTPTQARYYAILFYKASVAIKADAAKKRISLDDDDDNGKGKRRGRDDMEDGSVEQSNNDGQVQQIASRHFGVIDRFVNSPDAFLDFVDGTWTAEEEDVRRAKADLDPLTPEEREEWPLLVPEADDLISQKAKHAYELMYAHMEMNGALARVRAIKGSENFRSDPKHKFITLSPYKITGTHLYDRMPADLKAMCVRYQAGNFVEVERFKRDPKIKGIVADEISITEGHNLQMASRTIRMQGVWTPGAETQALARTRRPEINGSRTLLGYDVISAMLPGARPTIDDMRTARLLAKKLSNSRVEFGYELSYQRSVGQVVAALPPVKMSMANIEAFNPELLGQYFAALSALNNWAYDSSKVMTKRIGEEIFEATGERVLDDNGNVIDLGKFVAAAMVKTAPAPDLAGSRRSYVPWVGGKTPINPLGFPLTPVRSATPISVDDDDDSDDADGDEEEMSFERITNNVELDIGSYVMTEYGPGIVTRVGRRKKGAWADKDDNSPDAYHDASFFYIEIPSIKNGKVPLNVRLAADRIFAPADKNGDKALRDAIKSRVSTMAPTPNAISKDQIDTARDRKADRTAADARRNSNPEDDGAFADYGAPEVYDEDDFDFEGADFDILADDEEDPIDILADMMDEDGNIIGYDDDEVVPDDEDEDETADQLFGVGLAINGQLGILLDSESGDPDALDTVIADHQFKRFHDFARLEIKTKAALDTVLLKLAKARYIIPPQNLAEINAVAGALTQRGKLKQVEPFNFREVTNFMLTEQKRVPMSPNGNKPFRVYVLVVRGKFYLAAATTKHPFKVRDVFTRVAAGVPGIGKVEVFENMAIQFSRNKRHAQTIANTLIEAGLISNEEELLDDIASFGVGGANAMLLDPPEPKAAAVAPPKTAKPTVKPAAVPKAPAAPTKSDYVRGPNNPDVENLEEFRNFLAAKNATMVLVKGTVLPTGVPYRVKMHSTKQFGLSNLKNQSPDEFERFNVPTKGSDVRFDNVKGLMYIGQSVWHMSYTA